MSIAAILLALAAPNFSAMLQRQAVASNVESFLADLKLARTEAIKRGVPVELCPVDSPVTTPPTCMSEADAGAEDWATEGWMIIDANGTVIKRHQVGMGVGRISFNPATGQKSFLFTPNGIIAGAGFGSDLLITARDSSQTAAQQITCVNTTGRARVKKGASTCTD